jgi:hypothetical protein
MSIYFVLRPVYIIFAKDKRWRQYARIIPHLPLSISGLMNTVPRSAAGIIQVREESPGSAGRSTSENGSCR